MSRPSGEFAGEEEKREILSPADPNNPDSRPRPRGGRPTKLTPDVRERILNAVRAGNYLNAAAAYGGVTRHCLNEWMRRGRNSKRGDLHDFVRDVEKALAESEIKAVLVIGKAYEGNADVSPDKKAKVAMDFLERRFSHRWGRNKTVKHTGTGPGGSIDVRHGLTIHVVASPEVDAEGRIIGQGSALPVPETPVSLDGEPVAEPEPDRIAEEIDLEAGGEGVSGVIAALAWLVFVGGALAWVTFVWAVIAGFRRVSRFAKDAARPIEGSALSMEIRARQLRSAGASQEFIDNIERLAKEQAMQEDVALDAAVGSPQGWDEIDGEWRTYALWAVKRQRVYITP